ncbi:MAG: hypothetical protein C4293_18585 [Nitrospiraceae bacterium]
MPDHCDRHVAGDLRTEHAGYPHRGTGLPIRSFGDPALLRIVNEGREIHEFGSPLLSDPQVHVRIEPPQNLPSNVRITPGRTATITLQAPPGTYLFRCVIRGHAGMTGTLIIEEARTAS